MQVVVTGVDELHRKLTEFMETEADGIVRSVAGQNSVLGHLPVFSSQCLSVHMLVTRGKSYFVVTEIPD
jgi:hypothetical protein